MIVADTNVLVRLILNDDKDQAMRAGRLLQAHDVLLLTIILMEVEWVLRGKGKLKRAVVVEALEKLCGLPRVTIEQPAIVASALAAYRNGADFADALHVFAAEAAGARAFATFDLELQKRLAGISRINLLTP